MNLECTASAGGLSPETVRVPTKEGDGYLRCKVVADTVAAAVLLAAVSPLLLLLMGLIRISSRGPAIYSQRRTGRGGRDFLIYKLRSMTFDCERTTGPQWSKGRSDPRVTRFGRFLRLSHLDELPQLWNVIRGEMSLVGPRPERPEMIADLVKAIPCYPLRLQVLPGITGLAQVQLPPDEDLADVRHKTQCDLCYIERIGPWLDLKIMIATVLKVAGVSYRIAPRILSLPMPRAESCEESTSDPQPISQLQTM